MVQSDITPAIGGKQNRWLLLNSCYPSRLADLRAGHAVFVLVLLAGLCFHQSLQAQIAGLTFRSPPMTHAFIDSGDLMLGAGLYYSKIENPDYQVNGVDPDSITSTEQFIFLALGLTDSIALGISSNPAAIQLKGVDADSGAAVETNILSSRSYYYIIPTLVRWEKNRIALIWGKGRAVIQENTDLSISQEEYEIGTTGLVGEFFLGDAFSFVPWMSWPYLLFDIAPFYVAEVQTPDYGFDGILHFGESKLSLSLVFQALGTVDKESEEEENEREKSSNTKESTQESFAITLSHTF